MEENHYRELLGAMDRSLRHFREQPSEPGWDALIYDDLRRARETLIRAQRDFRQHVQPSTSNVQRPI